LGTCRLARDRVGGARGRAGVVCTSHVLPLTPQTHRACRPQLTRAAKESTEGATTTTTQAEPKGNMLERLADSAGVGLGPIGMSYQEGGGGKGAPFLLGLSIACVVPTAPHQLLACCTCLRLRSSNTH
jgi:hypothetical protein